MKKINLVSKKVEVSTRPIRCEWTPEMSADILTITSDWEEKMEKHILWEMRKLERMRKIEGFLGEI